MSMHFLRCAYLIIVLSINGSYALVALRAISNIPISNKLLSNVICFTNKQYYNFMYVLCSLFFSSTYKSILSFSRVVILRMRVAVGSCSHVLTFVTRISFEVAFLH